MKTYEFIAAEKAHYTVRELCENLKVSRSGYYAFRHAKPSKRARDDEWLTAQIRSVHAASKQRYGSPRVHAELVDQGERVGENRVARLMRLEGLRARPRSRFRVTTDSKHTYGVAPNLLQRCFTADAPDQVWAGDISVPQQAA